MPEEEEFGKKIEMWRKEARAAEEALAVADVGQALPPERLRAVADVLERWRALPAQEREVFEEGKGMSTPAFVLFRRLIEPERKEPTPSLEGEKPTRRRVSAARAFKCPFCPYEGTATNHVVLAHLEEMGRRLGGVAGKWKDTTLFTDVLNSIRAKFTGKTVRTEEVLDVLRGFFPWLGEGGLEDVARSYLAYTSIRHGSRRNTRWEVLGEKQEEPGPPPREGVPPSS